MGARIRLTFQAELHLPKRLRCQLFFSIGNTDSLLHGIAIGIGFDPLNLRRMQLPIIKVHRRRSSRTLR